MGTAIANGSVSMGGTTFPFRISQGDEGVILQDVTVEKGYPAVVTSGAGTLAGVITTTDSSPDITAADYVDIYWDGGILYNGDVTGVVAGAVTFQDDDSLGDVLPANTTACIISVRKLIVTDFVGNSVSCLAASCGSSRCHIGYVDDPDPTASAELFAVDIAAGEGWFWIEGMGFTNPLAGDTVAAIFVSTSDIVADQIFNVGVLYDSVS